MISLDIETTGLNTQLHEMASLGAVEIETGEEFYEECQLLEREVDLASPKALEINGFTEEELLDERKNRPYVVLQNFMEWAETLKYSKTLVGINLPSFDVQFLDKYYNTIGYKGPDWIFGHRFVDLHTMAFALTNISMNTLNMCDEFKVKREPSIHNALEGAKMNVRLYKAMMSILHDHGAQLEIDYFMVCNSGKNLHFDNPDPEEIELVDIAHALSQVPRYAGQGSFVNGRVYSVGMHSINAAWLVRDLGGTTMEQKIALLHDATEAYISDVPSPAKKLLPEYQRLEKKLANAIGKHFRLDLVNLPDIVKYADEQMLFWEAKQLYPQEFVEWAGEVKEEWLKRKSISAPDPVGCKILFQELYHEIEKGL